MPQWKVWCNHLGLIPAGPDWCLPPQVSGASWAEVLMEAGCPGFVHPQSTLNEGFDSRTRYHFKAVEG